MVRFGKKAAIVTAAGVLAAVSVAGCSSTLNPAAVVATVGDEDISLGVANFYTRMTQGEYETYYASMMGTTAEAMWAQEVDDAGTTVAREDFVEGKCVSDKIFVFVDQECGSSHLQTLPANMYACIYCDDFDKEQGYIAQLRSFTEENGLRIMGDYICEVLTELPFTDSGKREMFLRLQVPVYFRKQGEK